VAQNELGAGAMQVPTIEQRLASLEKKCEHHAAKQVRISFTPTSFKTNLVLV
jgi:hypothetical protein